VKTRLIFSVVVCLLGGCESPSQTHETTSTPTHAAPSVDIQPAGQTGFVERLHVDTRGNRSRFTVFVPSAYDASQPCPTILFLHGAGQIGNDGQAQIRGGLAEAIRSRAGSFPFLTVFPQSQQGSWEADSVDGRRAIAILAQVEREFRVDSSRTYLTGYSMGGEGTWSLAAAYPQKFAAIIPICPSRKLAAAPKLKKMPCWCFQGDADAPSTLADTRRMLLAIKAAGGRPIYHEYPGVEHNCWDMTYTNDEIYEWLLSHTLPRPG